MKINLKNQVWLSLRVAGLLLKRINNRQQIAKINKSKFPQALKIKESIVQTLNKNFPTEEILAMKEIEKVRKEYLNSEEEFPKWLPRDKTEGKEKLSDVTKRGSRSKFWGSLLFKLVRNLNPTDVIEIGSCVGLSGAYILQALKLNGKGSFTTLEGSPYRAKFAEKTFAKIGARNFAVEVGNFDNTLNDVLNKKEQIDFAFVDGNHSYKPTVNYFNTLLSFAKPNSVFVFDDINYSPEMLKAWKEISNDKNVCVALDLFVFGLVLVNCNSEQKEKYELSILKI